MQVNLKPSAMKNELNAALHFIKFIKRSRNLAVTDSTFNATLENTKDIITTFQVWDLPSTLAKPFSIV